VSQTISYPVVICDVLGALLNMSMTFVFLRFGHTGYIGAAYANVMAAWFTAGFMFFYVKFSGKEHIVWKLALENDGPPPISLKQYLAIAIPSAFSLWAEWWANQVLAIFAGWMPAGEMAVGGNGIIANFLGIIYMTFVAAQVSATTRVGNLVGKKEAKRIPMSILTAVGLSFILSGAAASALQVGGNSVIALYADNEDILDQAFHAKLGMVLSVVPYAVSMSLLGALRGAGQQTWGAIALAVAFYLIGLPTSAFLGLRTSLELQGLWLGNAIGLAVAAVAMGCRILWVNWEKVVKSAGVEANLTERLQETGGSDQLQETPTELER